MKSTRAILQCRANMEAVLSLYPDLHGCLTCCAVLTDRVLWRPAGELPVPNEAFHRFDFVRNHGVTALYGWREAVPRYSMQIVVHGGGMVETDIDEWNPDYGLLPAVLHLAREVLPHYLVRRRSDPFRIADGLRRVRGIVVKDWKTIEEV